MKPDKKMQSLGTILQGLINGGGLPIDPLVPQVIELWSEMIPEALRPYTCLEGLKGGTLQVVVSNPAAAQQFQFLKEPLRQEINRRLNQKIVKEVRLKTGNLPPQERSRNETEKNPPGSPRPLSRKEKKSIQQVSQDVKNPELRDRVRALMEKSLRFSAPADPGPRASKPRGSRKPPKQAGP
jgi:Dna[CI] antecedent, DciA